MEGFEIISRYSRAEAIEDGVLIDITKIATEAGFKYPVAVSCGVWELVQDAHEIGHKDISGVLWDILTLLRLEVKRNAESGTIYFMVWLYSKFTDKDALTTFKSVCSAGDRLEPVITVMLLHED